MATEPINKEPIYDELISPLMTQIIEICQLHNIPMVANFQLSDGNRPEDEDDKPMFCTSALAAEWQDQVMSDLVKVAYYQHVAVPSSMAFTFTKKSK